MITCSRWVMNETFVKGAIVVDSNSERKASRPTNALIWPSVATGCESTLSMRSFNWRSTVVPLSSRMVWVVLVVDSSADETSFEFINGESGRGTFWIVPLTLSSRLPTNTHVPGGKGSATGSVRLWSGPQAKPPSKQMCWGYNMTGRWLWSNLKTGGE